MTRTAGSIAVPPWRSKGSTHNPLTPCSVGREAQRHLWANCSTLKQGNRGCGKPVEWGLVVQAVREVDRLLTPMRQLLLRPDAAGSQQPPVRRQLFHAGELRPQRLPQRGRHAL